MEMEIAFSIKSIIVKWMQEPSWQGQELKLINFKVSDIQSYLSKNMSSLEILFSIELKFF